MGIESGLPAAPQRPRDTEVLSEEEAYKEATLVEAELAKRGWEKPMAGDYSLALKAVEELKKAAEEEPDAQKLLFKAGRIFHTLIGAGGFVPLGVLYVVEGLASAGGSMLAESSSPQGGYPRAKTELTPLASGVKEIYTFTGELLEDAAKKLARLEHIAQQREASAIENK